MGIVGRTGLHRLASHCLGIVGQTGLIASDAHVGYGIRYRVATHRPRKKLRTEFDECLQTIKRSKSRGDSEERAQTLSEKYPHGDQQRAFQNEDGRGSCRSFAIPGGEKPMLAVEIE